MVTSLTIGSADAISAVASAAAKATELSRKRLDAAARVRAARELGPVLRAAQGALRHRLAGTKGDSFTALQANAFRIQIAAMAEQLAMHLQITVGQLTGSAVVESVSALAAEINGMQSRLAASGLPMEHLSSLPLAEISRLSGAVSSKTSLLQEMFDRGKRSSLAYGQSMIKDFEKAIAVGLATGQSTDAVADALVSTNGAFAGAWWKAERIARTETAWAYNRSHSEAANSLGNDFVDVLMRWTEFVDDDTRQPLDDRVGDDSVQMHGQLRFPGQPFWDPVAKKSVQEPPNRPNDRATLVVWRASWGEPPGGLSRLDEASVAAFRKAAAMAKTGDPTGPGPV